MVDPMKATGFVTQLRIATRVRDIYGYGIHTDKTIPLGAVFQIETCQSPSHCPSAKSNHPVGDTGVDQ